MEAHSRIEKKKVRYESGSTGNVWVQRYTGLICTKPSITVSKVELSTRACVDFYEGACSELPMEGEVELKEWECVEVKHHKDVGRTVEEWQKKRLASPHLSSDWS